MALESIAAGEERPERDVGDQAPAHRGLEAGADAAGRLLASSASGADSADAGDRRAPVALERSAGAAGLDGEHVARREAERRRRRTSRGVGHVAEREVGGDRPRDSAGGGRRGAASTRLDLGAEHERGRRRASSTGASCRGGRGRARAAGGGRPRPRRRTCRRARRARAAGSSSSARWAMTSVSPAVRELVAARRAGRRAARGSCRSRR